MYQHILIAVDGSEHSRQAVPAAIEIAKKFDGDVFVLHVREGEVGRAAPYPMETPADSSQIVSDVVKTLQDSGVTARGEVQEAVAGHAPKHIVETAQSQGSDLIIMGSRGLSNLAGLLLGSVTHKVIQLAHKPVLVVRAPEVEGEQ
ncbi:MAG TPA: universal stress protein [Candidatus Dormibacteraeota bacterium]|jgi:nucleotide-binding universal stress UspA family protein|nr:universal stress protein [Candidatus Dormibacteraeota bacterium]